MIYHYIIYETAQTGYILAKEKSNLFQKEIEKQFYKISDFTAEQSYLGKSEHTIIAKLEPISTYSIETHKAVISMGEKKKSKSIIRMFVVPGKEDNLYFIATHNEIKDFTKVRRLEPSIDCFFSTIIKDEYGDDSVIEIYLN